MEDLMVRDAVLGDVQSITRVAEAGWVSAYQDVLAETTIEAALAEWYSPTLTRERIEDDAVTYLIAEQDDTVVGYASGAAADNSVVDLGSIYVTPDRWGRGSGRRCSTRSRRAGRPADTTPSNCSCSRTTRSASRSTVPRATRLSGSEKRSCSGRRSGNVAIAKNWDRGGGSRQ
ncbi:GNAT family N-acetyltransferase [Natronoarchaeum sp. GCM10025703]|uniref:GNAT family N-acetyltransferase n=1 Tax=Natronoarchaeum sp. GCM10025703 TaxID=3252685 RepID=UPI0036099239